MKAYKSYTIVEKYNKLFSKDMMNDYSELVEICKNDTIKLNKIKWIKYQLDKNEQNADTLSLLNDQINLNDSIIDFVKNISFCPARISKKYLIKQFIREQVFKESDSVTIVFNLQNQVSYLGNIWKITGASIPIELIDENTMIVKFNPQKYSIEHNKNIRKAIKIYLHNNFTNKNDTIYDLIQYKIVK